MTEQPYGGYYPPSGNVPPAGNLAGPGFGASRGSGKLLMQTSWKMLRRDRALMWLPAISAVFALIAAAILFAPGFAIGWAVGGGQHHSWGAWVGGVFAAFAASVVAIYFQAALVIGANERAEGHDPTLRGVLGQAWARKGVILTWALLTTSVGIAIRALEERFGALGRILGAVGGLAWAVASFLVVPVLVAENLGPIAAVKRSSHLLRETWGASLRSTVRIGLTQLLFFIPSIALIVAGVIVFNKDTASSHPIGIVLIVIGVAILLALGMVFSAMTTYSRALIYRYATNRPVPGVDPQLLAGAFRPKRGRGRFA
jgi:hypothetical protein